MATRTGQQYIAGLEDDRQVWLGARQVSVAKEPALRGSVMGMAGYFDWQHEYADDCLTEDPVSGQRMSASLIVPRNRDDMLRRHRCFDRLTRYSYGILGRTPDYCNASLSGQVARSDIWKKAGASSYHDRLKAFHREVIEGDLSLTHALVHATIDRGIGELAGINGDITLKVVRRNSEGIVVRGAKLLATLGPFADEIFVYPAAPMQAGFEDYALSFAIPVATKGVVQVCRDHFGLDGSVADHPFSSRFDEQDAFVIFDDVEVPWDRVFVDGQLDVYNAIPAGCFAGNVVHHAAIRAAAKLGFAYDLLTEMARVTNSEKRPEVAAQLGEVLSYQVLTRSAIEGCEARAYDWGGGAFFPHEDLGILRSIMPGWMTRVNDLIRNFGSHNMLCAPTREAFDDPTLGPLIERYLPGSNGISARERAQIMRTAWDYAGSALASRMELYERFYMASPARNQIRDHMVAQKTCEWGQVRAFLDKIGSGRP